MNLIKKGIVILCIGLSVFVLGSCSSFVEGFDLDPNNPTDVPPELLLPQTIMSMGSMHGEDLAWYCSVFIQTITGVDRQMGSATTYDVIAGDVSNAWNAAYSNHLNDLKVIIDKAADSGDPSYAGPARILTALSLGVMTDSWGDIPYSQALQGTQNTTPGFDNSQTGIYPAIQSLLDQAIADIANAKSISSSADFIYAGDLTKWEAAAYAIKARYANHLSEVDPGGSATTTLNAVNMALSKGFTDMMVPYGDAPNENNPWFQFEQQRTDWRMGKDFVDAMIAKNDPRLDEFCDPDAAGGFSGTPLEPRDGSASLVGPYYSAAAASLPFFTVAELYFIQAEAHLRAGNSADALQAFRNALENSMSTINSDGLDMAATDYIDAIVPANASGLTLELIMTEKYFAMFTQFESWVDVRRTGFPVITPYPGNSTIPLRYPYAQREVDLNPTNVPTSSLFAPAMFWDK